MDKTLKKSIFGCTIKPVVSKEIDKHLSLASLANLKGLVPDGINENDFLGISCNICVANRYNRNDDGIDGKTAKAIAASFVNKPINIEHDRNKIIGIITNYAFTKFGSDEVVEEDEVNDDEPFNIAIGGLIWKGINKNVAQYLEECSDPSSPSYTEISASWELGFYDYSLATLNGSSRNLSDSEMLELSDAEVSVVEKNLISEKGSGKYKGKRLVRKLMGKCETYGIGFVEDPAAEVKGVCTNKTTEENKSSEASLNQSVENTDNNEENVSTASFNISQEDNSNVNKENNIIMDKIKNVSEITDESLKQVKASTIRDFIAEQLEAANKSWVSEKANLETQSKTEKEQIATLNQANETLKKQLDEIQNQLKTVQEKEAVRQAQEVFSSRMNGLESKFGFSQEELTAIGSQVKEMSDESFDKYVKGLEVLLAAKNKKESTASTTQKTQPTQDNGDLKDALRNSQPDNPPVPNSSAPAKTSFKEKYANAFSLGKGVSVNLFKGRY